MERNSRKAWAAVTAITLICVIWTTAATAGVNAMSGKANLTYTKREVLPVGDTEGHVLMLTEASGPNTSTGGWDFMKGATATSRSQLDLTKGNGTQSGYFSLSKEEDMTTVSYSGTVRTVLTPEGKPFTSFSGEWKYVKCAGIYEGCTGQGVYQGYFTSETDSVVEFKGIIIQ
jgi:hypothetical protein